MRWAPSAGVGLAALVALCACKTGSATTSTAGELEAAYATLRQDLVQVAAALPAAEAEPAPLAPGGLAWLRSSPASPIGVLMEAQLTDAVTEQPEWAEQISDGSSFVDRCLDAVGPGAKPYDNGKVLFERQCGDVAKHLRAVLVVRVLDHQPPVREGALLKGGKLALHGFLVGLPRAGVPPKLLGGVKVEYQQEQDRLISTGVRPDPLRTEAALRRAFYSYVIDRLAQTLVASGVAVRTR